MSRQEEFGKCARQKKVVIQFADDAMISLDGKNAEEDNNINFAITGRKRTHQEGQREGKANKRLYHGESVRTRIVTAEGTTDKIPDVKIPDQEDQNAMVHGRKAPRTRARGMFRPSLCGQPAGDTGSRLFGAAREPIRARVMTGQKQLQRPEPIPRSAADRRWSRNTGRPVGQWLS